MLHVRGSTEQNTWTISPELIDVIKDDLAAVLRVTNKRGRSHTYTREEVLALWDNSGYVTTYNKHLAKVIRFPWHPLEM